VDGRIALHLKGLPKTGLADNYTRAYYTASGRAILSGERRRGGWRKLKRRRRGGVESCVLNARCHILQGRQRSRTCGSTAHRREMRVRIFNLQFSFLPSFPALACDHSLFSSSLPSFFPFPLRPPSVASFEAYPGRRHHSLYVQSLRGDPLCDHRFSILVNYRYISALPRLLIPLSFHHISLL